MFVLRWDNAGFELMAVGRRPMMTVWVAWGMIEETNYAAAVLGKMLFFTGWARRRTVSTAYACYGGYVLGLLLLFSLRQRLNFGGLQIGRFLVVLGLISM
jgi:hypothetical protein